MVQDEGQHTARRRHGDDASLVARLCVVRDELHRLAAEVAEDIATVERYEDVADLLCEMNLRLHDRGQLLAARRNSRVEP
ncbi:MAG: hypothetical protein M3Q39_14175 [Actinomycetota bacterium]|nr:hypothetical protein [Actinomycetota bacterium]